jgi:Ca-activated chloride channel family protein
MRTTPRRAEARRAATASALLALALILSPDAAPQTPPVAGEPAHITVDVNLVVLHATVTDSKGRIVSDLTQQDFQVYEDGVQQQIKLFAHEDLPVVAGLVVDHSGSMKRKLAEVSTAARTFVQASNPRDRMFVVNFNEHVQLGLSPTHPFSSDPVELEQAISQAPATGMTALYDAIVKALEMLKEGGPDKKVLLVISDGGDNASTHTLTETLRLAEQSDAIVYTVGIFDQYDPDRNPKVLRRLAEVTGGLAFFPTRLEEVSAICSRIAHDIRSQYTIGYTPSNPGRPGEYRTIRVVATAPNRGKLIVRTRTGYRVGGELR